MVNSAPRSRIAAVIGVVLAGWIMGCLFACAETSLGPLALVHLPLWTVVLGDIVTGTILALVCIELKSVLLAVVATAVLAAIFYPVFLVLPAGGARIYLSTLENQALTQAVPTFFLSLFLGFIGALVGTILNASVRGYEL